MHHTRLPRSGPAARRLPSGSVCARRISPRTGSLAEADRDGRQRSEVPFVARSQLQFRYMHFFSRTILGRRSRGRWWWVDGIAHPSTTGWRWDGRGDVHAGGWSRRDSACPTSATPGSSARTRSPSRCSVSAHSRRPVFWKGTLAVASLTLLSSSPLPALIASRFERACWSRAAHSPTSCSTCPCRWCSARRPDDRSIRRRYRLP